MKKPLLMIQTTILLLGLGLDLPACGTKPQADADASPAPAASRQTKAKALPAPPDGWKRHSFNRLTLIAPSDWTMLTDPMNRRTDADSIKTHNADSNQTVIVTISPAHGKPVDLIGATQRGARSMAMRASMVPEFRGASVRGSGKGGDLYGRKGVLVTSEMVSASDAVLMTIQSFGEHVESTDEVILLNTLVKGAPSGEVERIVRSIEVLPLKD